MSDAATGPVVAIVLAAGTSSRLGRPKQLLLLDGKPLVTHVVERALSSSVHRVVVVVGAEGERVTGALAHLDVDIVQNPAYASGQASSLVAGLAAVRDVADAVVVLLGDQPGIDPVDIDRVVAARRDGRATIVMATYGPDRGHPVLFGREMFDELSAITGDQGGREVIRRHPDAVVLVDATSDRIPADVDTESAWQHLQASWNA